MMLSVDDLKDTGLDFLDDDGLLKPAFVIVRTANRRVNAYPCRGGQFLNVGFVIRSYLPSFVR